MRKHNSLGFAAICSSILRNNLFKYNRLNFFFNRLKVDSKRRSSVTRRQMQNIGFQTWICRDIKGIFDPYWSTFYILHGFKIWKRKKFKNVLPHVGYDPLQLFLFLILISLFSLLFFISLSLSLSFSAIKSQQKGWDKQGVVVFRGLGDLIT